MWITGSLLFVEGSVKSEMELKPRCHFADNGSSRLQGVPRWEFVWTQGNLCARLIDGALKFLKERLKAWQTHGWSSVLHFLLCGRPRARPLRADETLKVCSSSLCLDKNWLDLLVFRGKGSFKWDISLPDTWTCPSLQSTGLNPLSRELWKLEMFCGKTTLTFKSQNLIWGQISAFASKKSPDVFLFT